MKKHFNKLKKHITKHYDKAIKQNASPHSIAIGFSIGTFIAIFPTFGLGLLIVLFIMLFYKNMSKIAAIAGLAFWNIFMMFPVFYFSSKIGKFVVNELGLKILETDLKFKEIMSATPFSWHNFWEFMNVYARDYLIGNTILSFLISIVCYFIVKEAVIDYRKLKALQLEKKKLKQKISKKK